MDVTRVDWDRIMSFLNLRPPEGLSREFIYLAHQALHEFDDVGDFIWKIPSFLDHETKLEKRKLKSYFPLSGNEEKDAFSTWLRSTRWAEESNKLENVFPHLIATGNLFTVLALFEAYCLKLGKILERQTGRSIQSVSGQGISRIFKFYSSVGVQYRTIRYYEQIDAALRIRNCLIHAEGLLSWSREERTLREMVQNRTYLQPELRAKKETPKSIRHRVSIVGGEIGDRLKITNDYAFDVVWYAKNYIIAAAEMAHFLTPNGLHRGRPIDYKLG